MKNIENMQDEVSYWISLEKKGVSLQKNKSFISWINKDEKNKIAFNEEQELFSLVTSLPETFLMELKEDVKENKKKENKRKKFIISFGTIASTACILLIAYFSFFSKDITFTKKYISAIKVREKILLPDNSIVSLDSNTAMTVDFYRDRREVYLSKGKAFFNISPNKKRPFFVKTDNTTIKVLGTKFEVINDKFFELNVKEGKVAIWNKYNKLIAFVKKDQRLVLNKYLSLDYLNKIDSSKIALWSEGKFHFNQETLKNVINIFSKYIDIDVEIKSKSLENLPISGNFTTEEFDKIINVLPLIHPVKIEKNKDKIIIMKKT